MTETRYRMVFLSLGLALIAVIVFAVLLSPDADESVLPNAIESVSPTDGATVLRQTDLIIDMQIGYEIEIFVDGVRIPDSEIRFVEGTGERTWIPGDQQTFPEWSPGLHSVLVRYDRIVGGVDIGEYRWVFRAQ